MKKGFTLIEVLVVVVILAILSAVAIPAYNGYIESSADQVVKSSSKTFENMIYTELQVKNSVDFAEMADKLKTSGDLTKTIESNKLTLKHAKAGIMGVIAIVNDSLKVSFPKVE